MRKTIMRTAGLYGALILGCAVVPASAVAQDYQGAVALRLTVPLNAPDTKSVRSTKAPWSQNQPAPYDLSVGLELRARDYSNRLGGNLYAANRLQPMGRSMGRRMTLAAYSFSGQDSHVLGYRWNDASRTLRMDGEEGEGSSGLLAIGGLALAGLAILAVTSGGDDPDVCIAIYPPPPGCA